MMTVTSSRVTVRVLVDLSLVWRSMRLTLSLFSGSKTVERSFLQKRLPTAIHTAGVVKSPLSSVQQASGLSPWIRLACVSKQQRSLQRLSSILQMQLSVLVLWLKAALTGVFPGSVTGVFQSLLSPVRIAAKPLSMTRHLTLSSSFSARRALMLGLPTILRPI